MANYVLDILSLSSNPISRLSGVNELCANDNWIIERTGNYYDFCLVKDDDAEHAICADNPIDETAQSYILKETTHTIDDVDHYSLQLTYEQLSNQLLNDISARFGFNTMAYREKWQYARANHSHDYSMVKCVPHVSYDDVVNAYIPNTQIMSYNTSRAGYGKMNNSSFDILKTISVIKRKAATIICLQQVDNNNSNTGSLYFLDKIKSCLGSNWNAYYTDITTFDADSGGGTSGLGILCKGPTPKTNASGTVPFVSVNNTKMQIAEFEDFVVANVDLPADADETWLTSIKRHFDENAYDGKAIFISGCWNKTPEQVLGTLSNFTIITKQEPTNIDSEVHDFILIDKQHYNALHNMSNSIVDDLVASDHKPTCSLFFYNSDYTKLDEWIASMEIWALSSWEEEKQGKYSKYKVKHNDYVPTRYDIFYPHINFPSYQRCQVGEVQLVARWHMPTNEDKQQYGNPFADETGFLYDDQNNGYWAYPQGQTITCHTFEFQEICKIYGNDDKSGNDTSFTLPCLSNYLSLNPHSDADNPLKHVNFEVGLPEHNHDFEVKFGTDESFKTYKLILKFNGRQNPGYSTQDTNYPHTGGSRKDPVNKYLDRQSDFHLKGSTSTVVVPQNTATTVGTDDVEVEPTHMDVPVLMFIGAK